MGIRITNYTLHHTTVKYLLNSTHEHFDIVIMEIFLNEAMLGFGCHFNAPTIAFSPIGSFKWTDDLVGSPAPISYVPHPFLRFTDHMTFLQRIENTLGILFEHIWMEWMYMPVQNQLYEGTFKSLCKTPLTTLRNNVSLVFLNNHFTLSYPRPYVPNMVEIGGIHINSTDQTQIPMEIKEFMDNAKHGIIYFSMGSSIQSIQFPDKIRDSILKAFANLSQKVLWKWEDSQLAGKPDNVLICKWFPQNAILAHPKTKLFITHGGLLSLTEAVYNGIPLIGIPVFGDQHLNMGHATALGYGFSIDYLNLTYESFTLALNTVLNNERLFII